MQTPRINDLPLETEIRVRRHATLDCFETTVKTLMDEGFGDLELHMNSNLVLVTDRTFNAILEAENA
jgi:hypothetical protein